MWRILLTTTRLDLRSQQVLTVTWNSTESWLSRRSILTATERLLGTTSRKEGLRRVGSTNTIQLRTPLLGITSTRAQEPQPLIRAQMETQELCMMRRGEREPAATVCSLMEMTK